MAREVWVAPAMHLRQGGQELHALGTPFQQNDLELTLPREVLSCQQLKWAKRGVAWRGCVLAWRGGSRVQKQLVRQVRSWTPYCAGA